MEPFSGTDRFVVERVLGRGGSGVVYQVFDRARQLRLALKTLQTQDASAIYRLKQEFRALADLAHPNLAALYELFSDGQQCFFTMELVDGAGFVRHVRGEGDDGAAATTRPRTASEGTVGEQDTGMTVGYDVTNVIPESPLAPIAPERLDTLRRCLRQLATGLGYLHGQGRLHHDVKSSNVLVTAANRVVLLDFGLVAEIGRRADDDRAVQGTLAYMSPEQIDRATATPASDWYSVGVMLYEALTGRLPFTGAPTDVLGAKRRGDPIAPRALAASVPEAWNDLCLELLSRDPARRPDAAHVMARLEQGGAGRVTIDVARPTSRLIGRTQELDGLRDAFEAASSGRTVVATVHGAPGIGKSALVRHFLEETRARDTDTVVLAGRCYERESVPYKALDSLVDALTQYLLGLPRAQVEAVLPRDVGALARVFPALRRIAAVAEARHRGGDISDTQEVRRRAFQAFRELVGRIADRQRLVLFIDDVHWGDSDSAAVLTEMLRPSDRPALLLLATYRSEEGHASPVVDALRQTASPGAVELREVSLDPLTAAESLGLARVLLDTRALAAPADDVEKLARESAGNPFFLYELVQDAGMEGDAGAAEDAGDISLERVIHRRIRRLPEAPRQLLETLAVYGRPVDLMLAARVADVEAQGLDALVALRGAGLVRTQTTPAGYDIEVYHDRIRETLLTGLDPQVLRTIHARFARVLAATETPDPERLALHFRGAGDHAMAAHYARRAAERAADALAFDRAAALYRETLDLLPADAADRHGIEVALGDALARGGRGREAARIFLATANAAPPTDALELTRRAAEQFLRAGYLDEGFVAIRAVLRAMGLTLAPSARHVIPGLILRKIWIRLRGLRFRPRAASDVPPLVLMRIDACWSLSVGLGIVDTVRGADFQARHLLLALRTGEPYRVARAVAMEAGYSSAQGPRARRRTEYLFGLAERLASQTRHPHAIALVCVARGLAGCMLGEWRAALAQCERADALLREQCTGVAWELSIAHLYSLFALSYLGEMRELVKRYPDYVTEARDREDVNAETNIRARIAYLGWLAAGDPDGAEREVREGLARWSHSGFHAQHYFEMGSHTEILLYRGRGMDAWRWFSSRWPHFRRSLLWRVDRIDIEALFFRGRAALAAHLEADAGREGRELLKIAGRCAAALTGRPSPTAHALGALLAAGVAAARGETPEAIAGFERADRLFAGCEMQLHAAIARFRQGQLRGGSEGSRLVGEAEAWMRDQALREPERWADVIAPGVQVARPAIAAL